MVLVLAPSTEASTAIAGGRRPNCWCAQIGPGGRPSIGPVPPPSAGSTGCCVVFAWAVGAGVRAATGIRGNTSKRGIAVEKAAVLKSGLGGSPVGMFELANALRANGLRPPIGSSRPVDVNNPILIRSRRETCPWEFDLIMSHRSLRACSASRKRAFEAFGDKKKFLSGIVSPLSVHKSPMGISGKRNGGGIRSSNAEPCADPGTTWCGLVMCQFLSDEKSWSPSQD